MAWSFSTGVSRGHEAAPLVVDNTMYIVTPWPNYLYALDLTKPSAPMKWVYQPNPTPASQDVACCDVVNRGAALPALLFTNPAEGGRSAPLPTCVLVLRPSGGQQPHACRFVIDLSC